MNEMKMVNASRPSTVCAKISPESIKISSYIIFKNCHGVLDNEAMPKCCQMCFVTLEKKYSNKDGAITCYISP